MDGAPLVAGLSLVALLLVAGSGVVGSGVADSAVATESAGLDSDVAGVTDTSAAGRGSALLAADFAGSRPSRGCPIICVLMMRIMPMTAAAPNTPNMAAPM